MLREGTLKKQHVFYKKDRTSSLIWIGIPSRDLKYKSEAQKRRLCCKYGVGRYRCIESNLRQGVDVDGRILQREKKKTIMDRALKNNSLNLVPGVGGGKKLRKTKKEEIQ